MNKIDVSYSVSNEKINIAVSAFMKSEPPPKDNGDYGLYCYTDEMGPCVIV